MKDIVYTYHKGEQAISITGFIASLLQQGEDWDIRCKGTTKNSISVLCVIT